MYLGIDTSTGIASIALVADNETLADCVITARNPGDSLVAGIDELVSTVGAARRDITGIYVGVGPGPYTSLRVGIAAARAIGLALDISVLGVCSHDGVVVPGSVSDYLVATDARRREIYWSHYIDSARVLGPTVGNPEQVVEQFGQTAWFGNGLDRYPELAAHVNYSSATPLASQLVLHGVAAQRRGEQPTTVHELAEHGTAPAPDTLVGTQLFAAYPLYLRNPDAKVPGR